MVIFNQPHKITIGDVLRGILGNNRVDSFDVFYILVAYAKMSGVSRLQNEILKFKEKGGQVKAVVGIGNKNTSVQAVRLLHQLCNEFYIYHNESPSTEFHPKVYAFEKINQRGLIFIGSSNLTAGGLYTNYETTTLLDLNLHNERQANIFDRFKNMFIFYATPSEYSKEVTLRFIQELIDGDYLADESTERREGHRDDGSNRQRIFGARTFHAPTVKVKGTLVWRKKNLPETDVQYVPPNSTRNPTGCLRLTQAGFRVNGQLIIPQSYFRNIVFGGFNWNVIRNNPYEEGTMVLFSITILGNHIGEYRLQIRHKPSGEAGQKNYTTSISWGTVARYLGRQELIGRTLNLYAPPTGQQEPFYIEIV